MKSKKQCMADELEALLSNFDEWASKDPEWVFINAEVVSDLSGISLSELRGLSGRDILFLLEQLQSGDDPGKILRGGFSVSTIIPLSDDRLITV
ncbi:MAG: hypothetical protein HYT48_03325 [Candidatus Vogelbacteria bacterium]|nr:hypothetical protein [Candidatus Vogelbacteria bacterium]